MTKKETKWFARAVKTWLLAFVFLLGGSVSTVYALTYYGPTPYFGVADSPFYGISFDYFYLEDFEDGALNTPGVSVNKGALVSSPSYGYSNVDSVDEDDGSIDGQCIIDCSAWWLSLRGWPGVEFTFDANVLGNLPTHAGLVFTDSIVGDWYFEAFDADGVSIGVYGPFIIGDQDWTSNVNDDRFFGVEYYGGISAIRLYYGVNIESYGLEVDHLQYGYSTLTPVPEPGTMLLVGSGLIGLAGLRRRSRRRAG